MLSSIYSRHFDFFDLACEMELNYGFLRASFGGDLKINEFRRNLFAAALLFYGLSWVASTPYAKNVTFDDGGVSVDFQIYESKRVNSDGSVCVDVSRLGVVVARCLDNKSIDEMVRNNWFIEYKKLSPEAARNISVLADDAFVYAEGGYSFIYPTSRKRIGDFIAYEAENVLCKDDSGGEASLRSVTWLHWLLRKNPMHHRQYLSPPLLKSHLLQVVGWSKEARGKVAAINAIIRSIKIDKW
ncbi:hypothetical protein [Burkholderia ambifaria]|uniref:hypothetical protein n=1 Tax=Burkholderia ambifaria TaxID=152480 RepID=UPI00158A989C|nr:hypothetical protein [Burkholderia ambifaria]